MITKKEFQDWLADPFYKPLVYRDTQSTHIYIKVPKNEDFDYLYGMTNYREDAIHRNQPFEYSGIYCKRDGLVYDAYQEYYHISPEIEAPYSQYQMRERLEKEVKAIIEARVADDRDNLEISELQSESEIESLSNFTSYTAEQLARRLFLHHQEDDVLRFHSEYYFGGWTENNLLEFILDPNAFTEKEADSYWNTYQDAILRQFMQNDLVKAELDRITEPEDSTLRRVRNIIDAIHEASPKSISVTIEKDGKKFVFKTEAQEFYGDPGSYYGLWYMTAKDRDAFAKAFGRGANYTPDDITCISYRGKAIYEAEPLLPAEDETEDEDEVPSLSM